MGTLTRIAHCAVAALILMTFGADATAAEQQTAAAWQALTVNDLDAARALLANNDPAMVPAVGDHAFAARLNASYAHALANAKAVAGYPGYLAVLGEFANSLDDGHIWSGPRYSAAPVQWAGIVFRPASIEWAGLVVAKRQRQWVITRKTPTIRNERLLGAHLIDCGGMPIDNFARRALGSHPGIVWSDEATQVLAAPWLLVDDGNPFVERPTFCTAALAGTTWKVELQWTLASQDEFRAMIRGTAHGAAGFGLRKVGSGYWVALEDLTGPAQPVIDAVKAHQTVLRASPYVVIDLRGNGGGDDAYGRALAEALYGRGHVESVLGPYGKDSACPEVWRASPGNIAAADRFANLAATSGDTTGSKAFRAAAAAMRAALAQQRALTGEARCMRPKRPPAAPAPSLMRGRVIVLTDSVCFSSCINTVGFFKKLGAALVGQATGADTHYSEVRSIVLPSGLATFTTLQAIIPDMPLHIGPYTPEFPYYGDISNTAALERWIGRSVVPDLQASNKT